jgi:hypothetical protein
MSDCFLVALRASMPMRRIDRAGALDASDIRSRGSLRRSLVSSAAFAQASAPLSRAEVKAETRAAEKAGQLTPAGEGSAPVTKSAATGPKITREQRKADTLQARKEGTLQPAGVTQKTDDAIRKQKSTKTRAERKAETMEARKKGELVPAGEDGEAGPWPIARVRSRRSFLPSVRDALQQMGHDRVLNASDIRSRGGLRPSLVVGGARSSQRADVAETGQGEQGQRAGELTRQAAAKRRGEIHPVRQEDDRSSARAGRSKPRRRRAGPGRRGLFRTASE